MKWSKPLQSDDQKYFRCLKIRTVDIDHSCLSELLITCVHWHDQDTEIAGIGKQGESEEFREKDVRRVK